MSYYPPAPPGYGRRPAPAPSRPDSGRAVRLVLLAVAAVVLGWPVICLLAVFGLVIAPIAGAALGVWVVIRPRRPQFRRRPVRRTRPPVHAPHRRHR